MNKSIVCFYKNLAHVTADLTIGFIGAPYRAMENMGPMIFTVAVNVIGNAMLTADVVVSFSTVDGTISGRNDYSSSVPLLLSKMFEGRIAAVAGSDYVGRSNVLLTFNAATTRLNVSVSLIDDNLSEKEEAFNGNLTLVSDSQRVTIVQGSAVATIVDDDSE